MEDFKAAILTINKISEGPLMANISFDWRDFKLDEIDSKEFGVRWALGKSCELSQPDIDVINGILKEGIKNENDLIGIGYRTWKLFPEEIQICLENFDIYAEKVYKESTSILPLIIFTDILTIPWELCVTKRSDIKKQKNWFRRYMVSTEIYGISKFEEITKEHERKKVSIILKPFIELEDEEMLSEYNEDSFLKEYNNLLSIIYELRRNYNIDISIHKCPQRLEELINIQEDLKKGEHDLLLYLGSYNPRYGLPLYDPTTKKPDYFDIKRIGSGRTEERAIFLDACCTALSKVEEELNCELPPIFLSRNVSAYIGTMGDIQPTTAAVFATHLLKSLFTEGNSISKAIYDAKTQAYDYLSEKFPNKQYNIQSCFYSLYGRNHDVLLNSFRRRRVGISFIYPEMIEQHFSGFMNFIYPASIPNLKLNKKDTLKEVITEIESSSEPFIADISISHAANLISKYRGDRNNELVIIGGVFRLLPNYDDSILYFFGNISDYDFFYSLDPLATVNIMAITHFINSDIEEVKKFTRPGGRRNMHYANIYDNALDAIKNNIDFEPFILVGTYREQFENELKKINLETKINRTSLYSRFLNILEEKYPKYKFEQNLPAEVLITRRKDIEKDEMLYREIFTRWINWEKGNRDKIMGTQDVFICFTMGDINTLIKFSRFVSERLKEFSIIKEPFDENDFWIIRPWEEEWTSQSVSFQPEKKYMEQSIELARKCEDEDEKPHPKVGCVIVTEDKVIEAYRNEVQLENGRADHAESIALKKCGTMDLRNAVLYTTLEPCTGRKHPDLSCAEKILQARIKKVVIGTYDPNPDIHCSGEDLLIRRYVDVYHFSGELKRELFEINKDFYNRYQSLKAP